MRDIFSNIYHKNLWRCDESVSGPSSTLARTYNLRNSLPDLFEKLNVGVVFDAPCGDFNWMRSVISGLSNIRYIGADIVSELIDINVLKNQDLQQVSFVHMDITVDLLPNADLMICRDCLFHFSYSDAARFLVNFSSSKIDYLLTTTHLNNNKFENKDIRTGDWRYMDLFLPPYAFNQDDVLYRIIDGGGDREMILLSRDAIRRSIINWL